LPLVVVFISATISSVAGTFWLDSRLRQNAMMSSFEFVRGRRVLKTF
jgi:hypothetical protein